MSQFPAKTVLIGYARVSTIEQNLDLQIAALEQAGCDHIFSDTASGSRCDRTGLCEALDRVASGDTLAVWKLDRLGRSASHLYRLLEQLRDKGALFRSLTDGIDTATATGSLIYGVLSAIAQFERDLIRERTLAGLAVARSNGVRLGRRRKLNKAQLRLLPSLLCEGKSRAEIAQILGCSERTVYRAIASISSEGISGMPLNYWLCDSEILGT